MSEPRPLPRRHWICLGTMYAGSQLTCPHGRRIECHHTPTGVLGIRWECGRCILVPVATLWDTVAVWCALRVARPWADDERRAWHWPV